MKRKAAAAENTPRQIALQVPKNINIVEMSPKEIEKLALDMARKAASSLPANSTLLGVDRVTLTNRAASDIGGWGQWSRGCGRPRELAREGLVINPDVFRSPIEGTSLPSKNVLNVGKTLSRAQTTAGKSAKKKSSKKSASKKSASKKTSGR